MPVMPVMPVMLVIPVMPVMPAIPVCLYTYIPALFYSASMPLFLHIL